MGRLLVEEDLVPQRIVSSTANRARSTAELVAGVLEDRPEIEETRDLYLASPHTALDVIADLGGAADPLLVVGHNPGVTALVTLLTDVCEEMPTAALAAIELDIDDWEGIAAGPRGRLIGFWRPKELR